MIIDRGVVKAGFEIEIPRWKNGNNYELVTRRLIDEGYMMGEWDDWAEIHRYRCTCGNGCGQVRRGDVYYPPIVSATYDASLPQGGCEYVTSPIVLINGGMEAVRPIWDIVTRDAEWTMELPRLRGDGLCSPSIHIHVSVTNPEPDEELMATDDGSLAGDIMHALYAYSPELLLLADTAGVRRGLEFRQLLRGNGGHHGFVHLRRAQDGDFLHIEWRLFEAAYDSWDYVEAVTYVSAALTRICSTTPGTQELLQGGLTNPFDRVALTRAVASNDTAAALAHANADRLLDLRRRLLDSLDDDVRGMEMVDALFAQAERLM